MGSRFAASDLTARRFRGRYHGTLILNVAIDRKRRRLRSTSKTRLYSELNRFITTRTKLERTSLHRLKQRQKGR